MGEVVSIGVAPTLDIPVSEVCDGARNWQEVLIIGTDENGDPCFASSSADKYKMLWLAERLKAKLVQS